MQKNKLKELLRILSPDGTEADFKSFDDNVEKLKKGLKEKIQVKTLEDVNAQLSRFKEQLDFTPLFDSIETIEKNLDEKIRAVAEILQTETTEFNTLLKENNGVFDQKIMSAQDSVEMLRAEHTALITQKDKDIADIKNRLAQLPDFETRVEATFADIRSAVVDIQDNEMWATIDDIQTVNDNLEKLRKELANRINNLSQHGGGNANRNIAIGGNTSVLSRYTDINLKAGNNVTITYAYNDTTKYTDVTIAATGGGGGGIIRSINSVAVNTAAGSTAGTDYVYLASGTTTITLPTAVANTNLYTIKNVGSGVVTVATTAVQTIDGSSTAVLPIQYTSIDLISDGTNWGVT